MEVHQDTCVNAIAALLCLLLHPGNITVVLSFLAVTNAFQQFCLVQTSVYVQKSVYLAQGN